MRQVAQNYRSGELAVIEAPAPICARGGVLVRSLYSLISTGTELMKVGESKMSLAGKARASMSSGYHGSEPGDPVRAAYAIIQAVDSNTPPLRLVLGPDALGAGRGKLAALAQNYDAWEQVSGSTNIA